MENGVRIESFEYSRNYHDELAEKHAFKLLQEVLASSIEKTHLMKGKWE